MKRACTRIWSSALALLLALCANAAHADFPNHNGAPGSQPGDDTTPFSGVATQPGADLFTGTASTVISIEVPPGRIDMTPKLELRYSSAGGRSPFGYGWDLSIGRISRSTKFGVPAYDNHSDTFVLELSGSSSELLAVAGTSKRYRTKIEGGFVRIGFDQTNNYWKVVDRHGTTFIFGRTAAQSRLGPDTSTSSQTFAWLLESAEDSFGNTIEYIYEEAVEGEASPPGLVKTILYGGSSNGLAHIFETRFDWYYPWNLSLPYHSKPNLSYSAGFAQTVEPRLLSRINTFADGKLARSYEVTQTMDPGSGVILLKSIGLRAQPLDVDVPESVFSYSPSVQLGFTVGINRKDEAIQIAAPGRGAFRDIGGNVTRWDTFDINGDGIVDWVEPKASDANARVYFGTGYGFEASPSPWPWPAAPPDDPTSDLRFIRTNQDDGDITADLFDISGDGLPDLVVTNKMGLVEEGGWWYQRMPCGGSQPDPQDLSQDLYVYWCVYLNTGDGFELDPILWPAPPTAGVIRNIDGGSDLWQDVVDLNGDGRPDFVKSNSWTPAQPYWQVYMNTGSGFDILDPSDNQSALGPVLWRAPSDRLSQVDKSRGKSHTRWGLSDINGDGLIDFVRASTTSVAIGENLTAAWDVYLNTGSGFATAEDGVSPSNQWKVEGAPPGATWLHTFYTRSKMLGADTNKTFDDFIDVTGDGLPDIIRRYGDWDEQAGIQQPVCTENLCVPPWQFAPDCCDMSLVFVNTGSSFLAPVGLPSWGGTGNSMGAFRYYSNNNSPNGREFDLFDFDGDGLVDLVERRYGADGEEWHIFRNPASPQPTDVASDDPYKTKPNLLVSMMNGLGGETTLRYTPVTLMGDSRCHSSSDPTDSDGVSGRCLPFPYWAVTSVTLRDMFGNTPPLETNYAYLDAYYDRNNREFRGFGLAWEVDPAGITTARYYHQDLVCSGRILESDTLGSPGPGCSNPDFADPDDPCSPWRFIISRTLNSWPCQSALSDWDSADPTPLLLTSTTSTPYRLPQTGPPVALTELAKTSSYTYDDYGNEIRREISSPLAGRLVSESLFQDTSVVDDANGMPDEYVVSRPSRISSYDDVDQNGTFQPGVDQRLQQKDFRYTPEYAVAISLDCRRWASNGECASSLKTIYSGFTNGLPARTDGPGRTRTSTLYDSHRLYPIEVTQPDKLRVRYQDYDYRIGKPRFTIDKSGQTTEADYDGLGRLLALWGPGRSSPNQPDSWTSYIYPDVELGREGSVVQDKRGAAPIVAFFDGFGRVIAKKTYLEVYDDQLGQDVGRTQISELKSYDAFGRVEYSALPFDVTNIQPSIFELDTDATASPLTERARIRYSDHTSRVEETWMPGPQSNPALQVFERSVPGVRAHRSATGLVELEYFDGLNRMLRREHCMIMPDLAAGQVCPPWLLVSRTSYSYDGLDRVVSIGIEDLESGQSHLMESNSYDGVGNKTSMLVANSGTWRYIYDDNSGLLVETIAPNGNHTRLKYGRNNQVKLAKIRTTESTIGSYKQIYRYYHRQGRLGAGQLERVRQKSRSSSGSTRFAHRYSYDHRGRIIAEGIAIASANPNGKTGYTFHYSYDEADRIIATSYPARDGDGRTIDENIFTDYSSYGRIKRVYSASTNYINDVGYDFFGNIARIDYGNDVHDLYRYLPGEENGYLECIRTTRDPSATPSEACSADPTRDFRAVRYSERDLSGRIKRIDDLLYPSDQPFSDYHDATYDILGRLTTVAYTAGAAVEETDSFAYDSIGRISARNNSSYLYDDPAHPHQLTRLVSPSGAITSLSYDPNGSRKAKGTKSYRYDAAGRLTRVADGDHLLQQNSYDETGQRIVRFNASSGILSHYYAGRFDVEGGTLVRHFYLGGRRIASERIQAPRDLSLAAATVLAAPTPGLGDDRWPLLPAQGVVVAQTRALSAQIGASLASAILVFIALGLGLAIVIVPGRSRVAAATAALYAVSILPVPLPGSALGSATVPMAEAQDLVGQRVFYHADHLGSPRAITNASGELVELLRYDVLGKLRGVYERVGAAIAEKTSGVSTNLTFSGHQPDEETALIYFGQRFYDPAVGYFLSIDPALQFASPYNYGGYDLLNSVDPSGTVLFSLGSALIVAALFAGAAVIDTLANGGDLGAALKAGAIAFGGSLLGSMSAQILNVAFSGVSAMQTLRVAYAGFGMYQTFKGGNIATGMLSLGLAAFGPPGGEETHSKGKEPAPGVAGGGQPQGNGRLASLERSTADPGAVNRSSEKMTGGVQVAGPFDSELAAAPGRAAALLNNRIIEARLDRAVEDLRIQDLRGEFEGFDVAAFKVRGIEHIADLDVDFLRFASVDVVKAPPNSPGFPQAFKPGSVSQHSPFRWVTVSAPIVIRLQTPIPLMPPGLR